MIRFFRALRACWWWAVGCWEDATVGTPTRPTPPMPAIYDAITGERIQAADGGPPLVHRGPVRIEEVQ